MGPALILGSMWFELPTDVGGSGVRQICWGEVERLRFTESRFIERACHEWQALEFLARQEGRA